MTGPIKACVIGWPITQSRSPLIHGHWLRTHGIDGSYTKVAVRPEELEAFLAGMAGEGFAGGNITVPHKEAVFRLATKRDAAAEAAGAANTIWFENSLLCAANTDTYGFLTHLDRTAPGWQESGRPACVLGAGGAARAVLQGLIAREIGQIRLLNRTRAKAEALAAAFGAGIKVHDWERRNEALEGCGLLVNTTTLGMSGAPALDIDLAGLAGDGVVYDLVYAPLETALLRQAAERGLVPVDGLGMLLHQAVPGFEKWFGVRPEVTDELRALVVADLAVD